MNNKIFRFILSGLLGISAILSVLFFLESISEGILIAWCYVLFAIATVAAIIFPIVNMISNPTGAKNVLIGVALTGLVFGIGFAFSTNEEYYTLSGVQLADAFESSYSEAGLIAFYIMGTTAILAVIYAEVSKLFK
ncbi:MAG: hypothetical protein IT232_11075 [Flavobacteriales bacterium]|nr:hypothetical protein [Flavobacteriales bacterium]